MLMDESSRTHLPINGNLTLKEIDKFDIVVQKVEGSSSSHPVYKDEIKD